MPRRPLAWVLRLLPILLPIALLGGPPARATDKLSRAATLHQDVHDHLDDPTLERRERAVLQMNEAIELDPEGRAGNHWALLAYVRELGGYDEEARLCYRRAQHQSPGDGEIMVGLGRVYRRQYLRTLDEDARDAAIAVLDSASRCRPPSSQPWLMLSSLLYEKGDLARATIAAERALDSHPRLPESGLAAAMMAWRNGDVERSDSLFRATFPLLKPDVRTYYDHPSQHVGRTTARGAAADVLPDPDPTTPQNELQLEYWSRVTHAYLLFNDPLRPALDERAETYMRYGPPAQVLYNPIGMSLEYRADPNDPGGDPGSRGVPRARYPLHAQVWLYPELNMQVVLHDRSLLGHWTLPAVREPLPNSTPDPRVLAQRGDLLAMSGGFGVLPTLPPPAQRLPLHARLVAFEGGDGPRLAAFVQADGETLQARWIVTDAAGHTVEQGARDMRHSLCGTGRSSGEIDATLLPGHYDVVVTARDRHGRRGIVRGSVSLPRDLDALVISDLVPCCGDPAMMVDRGAVRLEPLEGVVDGTAPLAVYFEIYHLSPGADGVCRYAFDWRVERITTDARGRPTGTTTTTTWASREELFRGTVRRQFLSVPMASLGRGRYRLGVTVHDTVAGTSDAGSMEFERP